MKYWALKWLIETVLKNFKCPECDSEINDGSIDIVWAAGNNINIDIECNNCWKHSMIKSEILTVDLTKLPVPWDIIDKLKNEIKNIKWNNTEKINEEKITDEKIVDLNSNLKKRNLNVMDLFWTEENK